MQQVSQIDQNTNITIEVTTNNISHFILTLAAIPAVIIKKYTTSSNGDFTGFLNLTIDNAPIIPIERAILFEITEVITQVIIGKTKIVIV